MTSFKVLRAGKRVKKAVTFDPVKGSQNIDFFG